MAIRDKTKQPFPGDGEPGKYQFVIDAAAQRGMDDMFIRTDCPCPATDCPHKGNCMACVNYHHMLSTVLGIRMVIPACAYFSERDYWMAKRKETDSEEVREAIDEWLAYYRDIHNLRVDMTRDPKFMEWDREYEHEVNSRWCMAYLEEDGEPKPAEKREERIAKNKREPEGVPGAYPYK